ncbi:hypothetical protein TBLA_0C01740 [Henningerozyma blattae CBS 6284]|uniref:Protein DSE1 n=1 Tax=Henningerozyma blattae (strain ATCC 34711 / CBS 6284 / DSM 70876 / NBRC 10599 / NRRL Y-10934 / UCD 77-7) TaxID=1071380 RepID=I2H0T6_HENB6|nr:hypothetical protein TBLA_0C01740 [Tetrapisispora blattae CBS 6284]CCH59988.1 hypothetical protein TBLA_0C01740 [Tetrapisispora blattae CBS 6284]
MMASTVTDIIANKTRNEEFKIWKKSIPSLYKHISTYKPKFQNSSSLGNNQSISVTGLTTTLSTNQNANNKIVFGNKVIPDQSNGTLTTTIYQTQNSDIYEIDTILPLGVYNIDQSTDIRSLNDTQYEDVTLKRMANTPIKPKWSFQGENITKLILNVNNNNNNNNPSNDDSGIIAMAETGSLAWFKNDIKIPVHTLQDAMGSSTNYSTIQSATSNISNDFDLSVDGLKLIASQCNKVVEESRSCVLKFVDNGEKVGEIINSFSIKDVGKIYSVNYFNNTLFSSISEDNIIRFWDTRSNSENPIFIFNNNTNNSNSTNNNSNENDQGLFLSMDHSSLIDSLFASGSTTGVVNLWDIRAVFGNSNISARASTSNEYGKIQPELATINQAGDDEVVDIKFSNTSPTDLISIGSSGNVYHWNMEPFFSSHSQDESEDSSTEYQTLLSDELQRECLSFLHTGGNRRKAMAKGQATHATSSISYKNTVALHPRINGLTGTVDPDNLLTVYLPFAGRAAEEAMDKVQSASM